MIAPTRTGRKRRRLPLPIYDERLGELLVE
jgi:hypothetical protein